MLIERKSILTGVVRTRDIPVTMEQMLAWEQGQLIQAAMPNISPEDREFIMTGVVSEEWDEAFKEDENE